MTAFLIVIQVLIIAFAAILPTLINRIDERDGLGMRLEIENEKEVETCFSENEEGYPARFAEMIDGRKRLERKFNKDSVTEFCGFLFEVKHVSTDRKEGCVRCRITKVVNGAGKIIYKE